MRIAWTTNFLTAFLLTVRCRLMLTVLKNCLQVDSWQQCGGSLTALNTVCDGFSPKLTEINEGSKRDLCNMSEHSTAIVRF